MLIAAQALGGVKVTLLGENISAVDFGGPATAAVRINADGTVDEIINGVASQIDALTDWIRPVTAAPDDYQVRATENSQSGTATRNGTLGTFLNVSGSPLWECIRSVVGIADWNLTLELRKGSGAVIDSDVYDLEAEVTI